jgi:hypothetical protein
MSCANMLDVSSRATESYGISTHQTPEHKLRLQIGFRCIASEATLAIARRFRLCSKMNGIWGENVKPHFVSFPLHCLITRCTKYLERVVSGFR